MAELAAPHGFAYLFERYPTFTQTFCIREVEAMQRRGLEFPIFSIHRRTNEPGPDCSSGDAKVTHLPEKFDDILAGDTEFRRAARRGQEMLQSLWGGHEQKRRVYEALWLGPRLQRAGVRHVHTHFAGMGARTAFWLNKLFRIRYSVTAHANDIFRDESPERLAQIFDAAEMVVTVSDYSLRHLREHFPRGAAKYYHVPNGVVVEQFRPSDFPPGRPLILGIGRYIEKKGFGVLIDACAKLGGQDFDCRIIGCGPLEEELKARVAALGVGDRVAITGPRTEAEIRELLAQARMFVLPCVTAGDRAKDNLPTVIMEAMAAGLPAISTPVAAVPEMIADGETGYLVPENDPGALAERMAVLLADSGRAREMGGRARIRCRQQYDVEQTSASLGEIFHRHGAIPDLGRRDAA